MDKKKIWQTALGELEVVLSKANYRTWFKETFIYSCENGIVIIAVPNSFTESWLRDKFHNQIIETLKKFIPELREIIYKITTQKPPEIEKIIIEEPAIPAFSLNETIRKPGELNPKYTFETYIVGSSNRLAHATSIAVASEPGTKHNPLFIYGGVGLGKTHLIQAVGNEISRRKPRKKIIYAPCEKFASEFIDSIQNKKTDFFKNKYRNADVLLIDDIQFLGGKESTQEEFFHTFNSIYQGNRQIILTSDKPPQALSNVANRLVSRFSGGMVADIKAPDLEMRQAILLAKCKEKNFSLEDKIINYVAQNVQSNIRELEGALNKIFTHCEIYNVTPSLNIATKVLDEIIASGKMQSLNPEKIFKVISDFFSVKKEEILGKKRQKELVHPRQISMLLLKQELNYSFPMIGKLLGGKDHTTIMYGVRKMEKEIQKNPQIHREISLIKEQLYIG
ncbi:hypothetical protein A3F08_02580 [Candidatus Berkelbacteria bacterium RIFCSPHIGHO2_12_FULL_36_9]|uniref:Chromosomal replication initiator protein DnaA n=1 Tax=Candidatus Berkelbacteria bacterium RIFCSPHIGHO2_12_FULL_36_9 TaxID=1797469 RepID=A0A1F5EFU0_9BACT|nr:MAG: hypothetical protein A3F08_02580 [Candidatus Berkelbacteria bacterium RIFCSPHIGHO2_12_FULL_36_9]